MKKNLYQNRFHTPEYFWFSPESLEFVGFELIGNQYQEITPNQRGWLWSQVLGLYLGVEGGKLRYFTLDGDLVPTPEEAATAQQQQAASAQQRAALAQQSAALAQQQASEAQQRAALAELRLQQELRRSLILAEQLRALGIDPDTLT